MSRAKKPKRPKTKRASRSLPDVEARLHKRMQSDYADLFNRIHAVHSITMNLRYSIQCLTGVVDADRKRTDNIADAVTWSSSGGMV